MTPIDRDPAFEAVTTRQPEWTQEQAVQYEVARESIATLMAFRSQWIFDEEHAGSPDLTAIARWRSERAVLAAELKGLDIRDQELIARICDTYGAEIRRLGALEQQRDRV